MRRLGVVAIVFAGLLAFLSVPTLLNRSLSLIDLRSPSWGAALIGLLPVVLLVGGGWFLIARRDRLAEAWFADAEADAALDPVSLLRVALIVTGLVMVVQTLAGAASTLALTIAQANTGLFAERLGFAQIVVSYLPFLAFALVTAILWLFIAVRAAPVAAWLMRPQKPRIAAPATPMVCPACGEPYDPADYEGGSGSPRCVRCHEPLPSGRA